MQENEQRDQQFRDAGADPSDVNAGGYSGRGRGGRGRARFSRNWREDPGPQDGGYRGGRGGFRGGRGRGGNGYGEQREFRGEPSQDASQPEGNTNSMQDNRFRDPYLLDTNNNNGDNTQNSFRPFRGGRGGRGRGGRGGRGGNYYNQDNEMVDRSTGNDRQPESQENDQDQGAYQPWRSEYGQRGGRQSNFKFEGRGRGYNNYRRGGYQNGNEDEYGGVQRNTNQNASEEPYESENNGYFKSRSAPSRDIAASPENQQQEETPSDSSPKSSSSPVSTKPFQRRQRAPHLRNNSRNEDDVLALFDCHHKQKGISLDNYGNIPVEMVPRDIDPVESFAELSVAPALAENIERCGYKTPTPVQRYGIPVALKGNDLMACAQTGSGKTAAFLIPIVNYILIHGVSPGKRGVSYPIGLVLAPTRELALQIFDEVRKITFRTDIFGDVVYGGTPYPSRFENDILVACPGRLSDMFERGLVSFSEIKFLVLDEADRMLEMGFEEQIEHLVASRYSDMPKSDERQTLMFSATFPQRILNLAKRYLRKHYYLLTVGRVGSTTKNITQVIERIENEDKIDRLFKLIYEHKKTDLVLVFVETKKAAEDLHRELNRENIPSATIHGDRRQQDRENALASFKSGETPILVATDVASRGLDIPDVSHVIQFDLPSEMDDYTHRIGRTGRAGNKGTATCFYNKNNRKICMELYKYFSEHDQHIPSWFKEEAEHIEGEAMLSRGALGGNRGNRRRVVEDNQGTWGDSCAPRAPRANQAPKKKVFVDDGGF